MSSSGQPGLVGSLNISQAAESKGPQREVRTAAPPAGGGAPRGLGAVEHASPARRRGHHSH